jgi:nicotinamidase-related amidase
MNTSEKSLLLVIDMQEGFRTRESEKILPVIKKLINEFAGKIVFSKFENKKGSLFETQLNWTKFQNKFDKKILTELKYSNSSKITHNTYTIYNKKLKRFVLKNKINKIYLCGVYTDVCIIKTVMDLFDNGFIVYVIANACNSLHGTKNHEYALDSLKHIIGGHHVINSKKLI